jgi:hypothetical protein
MFHDRIAYPLSYGLASRLARVSAGGGVFFSGTTLDMIFAANTYKGATPANLTATRASTGYAEDTSGVWSSFGNNVARITDRGLLVEEARTNSIRNNSMQGAVAGTPGTMPTNWLSYFSSGTGVTSTIVGTGTENGIDYIDIRLSGTHSGSAQWSIAFESTTGIVAATAQVWAASAFIKVADGSLTGISSTLLGIDENTSGGSYVAGGTGAITLTNSFSRHSYVRTLTGGGTVARAMPFFRMSIAGSTAIDITLRIGWPQLELGAFATSPIRTTSGAVTRAADDVSLQTTAFSSWYTGGTTAGTIYAEYQQLGAGLTGFGRIIEFNDGATTEVINLGLTSPNYLWQIVDGGVTQANPGRVAPAFGSNVKSAMGYALNDVQSVHDGLLATLDSSVTIPTPDRVHFGNRFAVDRGSAVWIRRLAYFPSRLANATLQTITATTAHPRLVSLPVISGTATEGNTLTVSNGYWLEAPTSYTYQWTRDGASIGGATSRTFALTDTDGSKSIACVVTATNANGSTAATANSVLVGEAEPQNTVLPTITGIEAVGDTLTAGDGTWTNSPTGYTYQWNRDGSPIGSATSSTYTLIEADEGTLITVAVTASNAAGAGPGATSAPSNTVGPVVADSGALDLYAGGELQLYAGGNLELYAAVSLFLYAGGLLELYSGGALQLYGAIPADALTLAGVPILDTLGRYILV